MLGVRKTTALKLRGATVGAACEVIEGPVIGMGGHPGLQLLVQLLQNAHVLPVVPLHALPRGLIARHALHPQLEALVLDLGFQAQGAAHILQLGARETEPLLHHLAQVDALVGCGGCEAL